MYALHQYLNTLRDSLGLTRTLGEITLCCDEEGRPRYSVGNSAAVFCIEHEGRKCALRCYLRGAKHLKAIYGEALLERELYLYDTPSSGRWVDVVLTEWVEGRSLDEVIAEALGRGNSATLAKLAQAFDRLAGEMLSAPWAHGDLKPENIIVTPSGEMRLIDWDAKFLPEFAGEQSPELGTAAFQHPTRTLEAFDAHLDDFPIALISTALHALALEPSLAERYTEEDGLLLSPRNIARQASYQAVLRLFSERGEALRYRIARLLCSPTYRLFDLRRLFAYGAQTTPLAAPDQPLELFEEEGLWGYRTAERVVIPPLYDCGFEPSEGILTVQVGSVWHYMDPSGRLLRSCPDCEAVKPVKAGYATLVRHGEREQIPLCAEM